ncbi:MAG TPA: bifunctional hydroxymethylpyrimidine kinase/phosphomethylpyrimidine kinase [Mycobacteriales bacterium]
MVVNVLSVAGSDPSGGAGIQADLKTFAALGAYGMAAITALTVQNTQGVRAVHPVDPAVIAAQVEAVLDDVRVDAVKIGMLGDAAGIAALAQVLRARRPPVVVLDPVLVATSGDALLPGGAVPTLLADLLPLADLVTPNVPEAAALLGVEPAGDEQEQARQAAALAALGPAVLLKGGHLGGTESVDVLAGGGSTTRLAAPRVATTATHGTGCTLSSALAALRPLHPDWAGTARAAKAYVSRALLAGADLDVGRGHGPLRHDV